MFAIDFDPFEKGYVATLPGREASVTGLFIRQPELAANRVELTREAFVRGARRRPLVGRCIPRPSRGSRGGE
jgi:hypothetical protein